MPIDKDTGQGEYPKEKWDQPFQDLDKELKKPLFEFGVLGVVAPPKKDIAKGLKTLEEYEQKRTADQRADVMRQAEPSLPAILPVLAAFGLSYENDGEADALIRTILLNIQYPVFWWKAKYGRARPRMKAKEFGVVLNPMLEPGNSFHPGHGSYPSGHAAIAFCWAELLGELPGGSAKKADALMAAGEVAKYREIAGLHFPSDSIAGEKLGIDIAKAILAAQRLTPREIKVLLNKN